MYFHGRPQCAARSLGQIVLASGAHCDFPDRREASQLTRQSLFVYFGAADGTDPVQP